MVFTQNLGLRQLFQRWLLTPFAGKSRSVVNIPEKRCVAINRPDLNIGVGSQNGSDNGHVTLVNSPMQASFVILSFYIHIGIFTDQGFYNTFMSTFWSMNEVGISGSVLENQMVRLFVQSNCSKKQPLGNLPVYLTCKFVYAPADNNLNAISL